jgi:hypothetical protein
MFLMTYRDELKSLFDVQLQKMFKMIDYQISTMARVAPNDQIVSY